MWAVRPAAILKKYAGLLDTFTANTGGFIDVDKLAKAMLKIALDGYADRIVEADALVKI